MANGKTLAEILLENKGGGAVGDAAVQAKLNATGTLNSNTKAQITALAALTGAFGSTGNAIVDVTATPTQTLVNNNFRVLEDKINAIIAALKA